MLVGLNNCVASDSSGAHLSVRLVHPLYYGRSASHLCIPFGARSVSWIPTTDDTEGHQMGELITDGLYPYPKQNTTTFGYCSSQTDVSLILSTTASGKERFMLCGASIHTSYVRVLHDPSEEDKERWGTLSKYLVHAQTIYHS